MFTKELKFKKDTIKEQGGKRKEEKKEERKEW
jgi:hypothetical protein